MEKMISKTWLSLQVFFLSISVIIFSWTGSIISQCYKLHWVNTAGFFVYFRQQNSKCEYFEGIIVFYTHSLCFSSITTLFTQWLKVKISHSYSNTNQKLVFIWNNCPIATQNNRILPWPVWLSILLTFSLLL